MGIFFLTFYKKSAKIIPSALMADVAQLVRALVCGTRCREFESHLPPHIENKPLKTGAFLLPKMLVFRCNTEV